MKRLGEPEQMPQSLALPGNNAAIRFTRFAEWERRGRGWDVYLNPVPLEPRFEPIARPVVQNPRVVDDARRPSLMQSLLGSARRFVRSQDEADDLPSREPSSSTLQPPFSAVD